MSILSLRPRCVTAETGEIGLVSKRHPPNVLEWIDSHLQERVVMAMDMTGGLLCRPTPPLRDIFPTMKFARAEDVRH